MVTVSTALRALSILVQLFSKPQHTQAPSTSRAPRLKTRPLPSHPSRALAAVTSAMAAHSRRERASLKTARAIREVATISKLLSRDTVEELVRATPIISRIGAAMSNTTMARIQGSSFRVRGLAGAGRPMPRPASRHSSRPAPAPR